VDSPKPKGPFERLDEELLIEIQQKWNKEGGIDPSTSPRVPQGDAPKPSYPQDWRAYNLSQQVEKRVFMLLLADICSRVQQPAYKFGRPTIPLSDMIYGMVFKTYSTFSGRRFTSDMVLAKEKGYVGDQPHFNSIFNYLRREDLTPLLTQLVTLTSLPLRTIEKDFAVDSTGFGTGQFMRWFSFKHGKEKTTRKWVKCHIATGVTTNIVTSVKITGGFDGDCPYLKELVEKTAEHFNMAEVSADKAYLSQDNLKLIHDLDAMPFIPFKSNNKRNGHGIVWKKLYHLFWDEASFFMKHYHKRSNVETTFHMIKKKFGDYVRSKTWTAQVNEVLCKVIAHNICVTIQEINERGISVDYSTPSTLETSELTSN
jgi:transposase